MANPFTPLRRFLPKRLALPSGKPILADCNPCDAKTHRPWWCNTVQLTRSFSQRRRQACCCGGYPYPYYVYPKSFGTCANCGPVPIGLEITLSSIADGKCTGTCSNFPGMALCSGMNGSYVVTQKSACYWQGPAPTIHLCGDTSGATIYGGIITTTLRIYTATGLVAIYPEIQVGVSTFMGCGATCPWDFSTGPLIQSAASCLDALMNGFSWTDSTSGVHIAVVGI